MSDRIFYLKAALVAKVIDLAQYNEALKVLEKDLTQDSRKLLLDLGYINQDELEKIDSFINQSGSENTIAGMTSDDGTSSKPSNDYNLISDRYDLRGIIGHGGVGRVFLSYDRNLEREVAIKELNIDKSSIGYNNTLKKFINEARVTGRLEHPSVVPVYEVATNSEGNFFYVMKYVRGKTFFEALNEAEKDCINVYKNRMSLLDNLIAVCDAMAYAHKKGFIHRDLKPGNIVLGEFGETIILDWGLAKNINKGKVEKKVEKKDYKLVGTISYMPPEQADPDFGEIDERSDVYSLGVILFMILTGRKIYEGDKNERLEQLTSSKATPSPEEFCELIPPDLAAICKKATSKIKDERFQDAGELAKQLKAYRDGRLVSIYAYTRKELLKRFVSRNKPLVGLILALIIAISIGGALSFKFGLEAHKARIIAENALQDITGLSQESIQVSQRCVSELESYFSNLNKDILIAIDKSDVSNISVLKELYSKFPEVTAFEFISIEGKIVSSAPDRSNTGLDISRLFHIKDVLKLKKTIISKSFKSNSGEYFVALVYPVIRGNKVHGIIAALIQTEVFIPKLLSLHPLESSFQVWVMEDSGYILYDEDPKQAGKILFSDEMYKNFPELQKFGENVVQDKWGVGHYEFFINDGAKLVHKVGAWNTLEFDFVSNKESQINWKVIITHPYVTVK